MHHFGADSLIDFEDFLDDHPALGDVTEFHIDGPGRFLQYSIGAIGRN